MKQQQANYDGCIRADLAIGDRVDIVLKKDQQTGRLTRGIVKTILTNKGYNSRGIKVMLEDKHVGRVRRIVEKTGGGDNA